MLLILDLIIFLILSVIIFQDFKDHLISWFLIPLILVAMIYYGSLNLIIQEQIKFFLINLSFIILQLIGVMAYYLVKNRKFTNIINRQLGIGDVLFFLVLCFAFSPVNFIVFFFLSLVITLLGYLLFLGFMKSKTRNIPLAGVFALIFSIIKISSFFSNNYNLYSDSFWESWIIKIM
jgi:hypothetical protein